VAHAPSGFGAKQHWLKDMAHAALAPGIGREYDPFLFASIGEDRHGHPLTVISALAQSDVDPWLEAVGLARLSRDQATARLCRLIAALPGGPASDRSVDAIAGELVALLPRIDKYAPPRNDAPPETAAPAAVMTPIGRFGLGAVALALLMALSLLFSTHTPPGADQIRPPLAPDQRDSAKPLPTGSDYRP
jgi:hypothetical protein